MRGNPYCYYYYAVAIAAVVLSFPVLFVQCQVADDDSTNPVVNPTLVPLLTQVVYGRLSNLTSTILSAQFTKNPSFCIKNPEVEWNQAFNYSSNLTFLRSCIQKTKGDVLQRLCTPAEAKLYFKNFVGGGSQSVPNKNCNLTSRPWVPGCEPGWACSVKPNDVDLNNSKDIPSRTLDCQACCEGFFCPVGLTCMIPCPLGSYCPLATLNVTTGMCDPYRYRPAGQLNHTCGAANIWTDVDRSSEVFCSAGSYCPSSNKKVSCGRGHYCRMGSTYGNLLSIRERRHAKSREAAARSVRGKAQARKGWKSAKTAALNHVRGLQSQFSRTFSRRKTVTPSEELRILSQTEVEIDDDLHPITHASILTSSEQLSAAVGRKKLELSGVMRGIHATEEGPDIRNDSSIEVEEKNVKRPMPKKSHLHTDSQIFEYAYDQLEKEKAMQQENLTFSGVISMANNREIRKRPIIEVSFRDLTLTLKGKNKHLLRCVTGRIEPGRITAVMGPSGAGKTTFLSALVGKTVGCKMTGSILINGKNESIHSYRKVIGFVPQDDIVHGNLTVEENLWFSARCRLSANLLKEDKVLILERVIESLGLQAVRDSLVGTVEKRGISGGQRKRVNVGLELVMEPSLLILDEPTSGLDSSSSQLLLRALRREALVGVNICMVVHQPRVVKQRLREARILAVDFLILLLAGACLGYLIKMNDKTFGAESYTYTIIAVSLLCTISALRTFSLDKLQYWRESAAGISSLAHFLSKDTIDHLNTVIKPVVYLSMFYFISHPRSSFSDNYVVLLCLVYCVTGIGYSLSIFLEPGPSQLCAVLLPVVLTLISTQTGHGAFVKNLANLCFPKWALEAFIVANAERYSGVWIITRCGLLKRMGYSLNGWGRCISFLILAGVVTRALAFIGMLVLKRKH